VFETHPDLRKQLDEVRTLLEPFPFFTATELAQILNAPRWLLHLDERDGA
jgi:hypothetical protein